MADSMTGYARPELLADTAWLEQHLQDPQVRIIDCDPYDVYRRAHIQNAVGLRVHHYLKAEEGAVHIMPPDKFAQLMGSMGVSNDTLVVAYDGFGGLYATRMWWVLNLYGHTKVKVLDGGWNKWFQERRPMTQDVPRPGKTPFQSKANDHLLSNLDYAKQCVGRQGVKLLDVRSEGEWRGGTLRGNKHGGHMPGAAHLEWLHFVTDDGPRTMKPAGELREMLRKVGVTPNQEVVTYCESGVRAAQGAFTLTLLGFPKVRVYDGSWKEWGNRDDTPIEK